MPSNIMDEIRLSNHVDVIRWGNTLVIKLKLYIEAHGPIETPAGTITMDDVNQWRKHDNELDRCKEERPWRPS